MSDTDIKRWAETWESAGRERDWADIESVVIRQSRRLDWPLVFEELAPLAELRGGDETAARLRRLREK